MITQILELARRGKNRIPSLTGGTFGGSGYGGARVFGYASEGLDLNKEAGIRWDNSIIYSILSFGARCLSSCPILVAREDGTGQANPIENHPIEVLLNKPTPWYDGSFLETCQCWSEMSRGNSYAYKHRSAAGKTVAIEYLPEGTCFPYTIPGSGDWISFYRVSTAFGYYQVPVEDILHMRWMTPNVYWPQLGMSPIDGCLPELVADKKASRHEAVILNNSGVSPLIGMPKAFPKDDVEYELTEPQQRQIEATIFDKITGDNKGKAAVLNIPMEWFKAAFDPDQLHLHDTHAHSEQRICAAYGIQPVALALGTGLENSNNRASIEGAINLTFDAFVIPYMRHRGAQLTEDLVPELGRPGDVVVYDESKLPAVKERLLREIRENTGGPVWTPDEGRAVAGLPPVKGGDEIYFPRGSFPISVAVEGVPGSANRDDKRQIATDIGGATGLGINAEE